MKKNSIFKQAAFLAAAGILVRIIGLLYRSPLTKLIGSQGMGYYSTAYNVYALILLVSSYSIPTAISKLLSENWPLINIIMLKRFFFAHLFILLQLVEEQQLSHL